MKKGSKRILSATDSYLFHEGTFCDLHRRLGARRVRRDGASGVLFALWAPHAREVSLLTPQNAFAVGATPLSLAADGIWEVFVPALPDGTPYRYAVLGADGILRYKSDPMARSFEVRPANASLVTSPSRFVWRDGAWIASRKSDNRADPMAIYEVHLGSWKRKEDGSFLSYRESANALCEYLLFMGYTHAEFIGICEHPLDASWGYQVTGYFAPTSRYGSPDDFRYLVDTLHRAGIGVILDWVPAHFPKDAFGLERFDGTPLFESPDPLLAEYPEWGTMAFDYAKGEVCSFLLSSAVYWAEEFHVDALRIDAVAAMFFTSFGRREWRPNRGGGIENDEGIAFLKRLNTLLPARTGAITIAEDSSIMAGVTKPTPEGIGFAYKWNMGWMNEILRYLKLDPIFRRHEHGLLTHSPDYAFLENFVLPLSHDEVVHLKASMLGKQPGSPAEKIGGLKSLYTLFFTHPGKKLLFMGQEFGAEHEWDEKVSLDWSLADEPFHRDILLTVKSLLALYRKYPVLHNDEGNPTTFEWVERENADRNLIVYLRRNPWNYRDALAVVCAFSPMAYGDFSFGVPEGGRYRRVFSTYDTLPGAREEHPTVTAQPALCDGYPYRLPCPLRPFESVVYEKAEEEKE